MVTVNGLILDTTYEQIIEDFIWNDGWYYTTNGLKTENPSYAISNKISLKKGDMIDFGNIDINPIICCVNSFNSDDSLKYPLKLGTSDSYIYSPRRCHYIYLYIKIF